MINKKIFLKATNIENLDYIYFFVFGKRRHLAGVGRFETENYI